MIFVIIHDNKIFKYCHISARMFNQISNHLSQYLNNFPQEETIIFNNQHHKIDENQFLKIIPSFEKSISFIDGGQAEILFSGNFNLSFIRVSSLTLDNGVKKQSKKEFFLLTTAKYHDNDIHYVSKIFGDKIIDENDLFISSNDVSIKASNERAPISKVINIARRFAELSLASKTETEFVILDGTLEKTYKNEEKYLEKLNSNTCSLAKSSSLFTTSGNSPVIVMNKKGPEGCWYYQINNKTCFVKLHSKAKHVFRFEGNKGILSYLADNSKDALFLGYPYGLLLVDKIARVSNEEKRLLRAKFILDEKNKEIVQFLSTTNAHEILDNLG